MNDRIPGTTFDNPIWYKGYRIYLSDLYDTHGYEFKYVDAGDNCCGVGKSIEDCKQEIDDRENHPHSRS